MNINLSGDPFAGIVVPPIPALRQVGDSMGEQSVAVQVYAEKTQLNDPGDLVKPTKRPMKPTTDSASVGNTEPLTVENGPINTVGADGTLNAVTKHSTWVPGTTFPTTLKTVDGTNSIVLNTSGFEVNNGTQTVRIFFNAFTKNMAIKEIDVCVDGVNKKMLILASDPYIP